MLYATDFHNNKVVQLNSSFAVIPPASATSFVDPGLPAGESAFGIQAIGGKIFVAYALLGPDGKTQVKQAGSGVVDEFDTAGNFVMRIATQGVLNAPWGLAMAPSNFGAFSNDLLVGNFGDGTIDAFNPTTGALVGPLKQANGSAIVEPGVWGIAFGNNVDNQPLNTLFFAAGPTLTTGLYGRIDVSQ